jgi:hypothetical protein
MTTSPNSEQTPTNTFTVTISDGTNSAVFANIPGAVHTDAARTVLNTSPKNWAQVIDGISSTGSTTTVTITITQP